MSRDRKDEEARKRYFLPSEVAQHHTAADFWLSCLGRVYELTDYLAHIGADSPIGKYLMAHAGKDVSHWFDASSQRCGCNAQLRRYVEPATGRLRIVLPYNNPIPEGAYSTYLPDEEDCSRGASSCSLAENADNTKPEVTGKCWSELERILNGSDYQRGWLTKKPRPCSIMNVLTGQRAIISVCAEDSIERIQERFLPFNRHGASYSWKFEGRLLDSGLTLEENGIADERDRYLACGLPDDHTTYIPNLLCYFNDDLTEM